jgi:hypothetical protein
LGYYTDFENRAKLRPSHRINTFAFANAADSGIGCFLCNQLLPHTLTTQTATLAYANPPRGDVSPLQPMRSIVFDSAVGNQGRYCKILPTVN